MIRYVKGDLFTRLPDEGTTDHVVVVNMFAQEGVGLSRDGSGNLLPPIRYDALEACMALVRDAIKVNDESARIVAPPFGTGLAGADWTVIEPLIQRLWVDEGIPVTVAYLPPFTPPTFDVVCVKDGLNSDLEINKVYKAIPDVDAERQGMIRAVDESGEDYLYPKDFFMLLNEKPNE